MGVEESYSAISWFFEAWVRLIEYHTREMETVDSAHLGSRRLIISPPTDAGIPLLARANANGTTELLCFSDRIDRIAAGFCKRRRVDSLRALVEPFFKIPVPDESLSVVYANCFFDFCAIEELDTILLEILRVLEPAGVLFAVYMAPPCTWGGRLWSWIFDRFTSLSNGCAPVSIAPRLTRNGYRILKDVSAVRLGFPARYTLSEKPRPV